MKRKQTQSWLGLYAFLTRLLSVFNAFLTRLLSVFNAFLTRLLSVFNAFLTRLLSVFNAFWMRSMVQFRTKLKPVLMNKKRVFKTNFSYFIAFSYILHSAADLKNPTFLISSGSQFILKKVFKCWSIDLWSKLELDSLSLQDIWDQEPLQPFSYCERFRFTAQIKSETIQTQAFSIGERFVRVTPLSPRN